MIGLGRLRGGTVRIGRAAGALVAAILMLSPLSAHAQDPGAATAAGTRTVRLRDGSMVRGEVLEEVSGDHVLVRLVTGELRRIAWADVIEVTSPEDAGSPAAPPVPVPPPPPPLPRPTVTLDSNDARAGLCTLRPEVVTWVGRRGFTHEGVNLDWGQVCQGSCGQAVDAGQYTICGDGIRSSDVFSIPQGSAPVRLGVEAHGSWTRSIGILLTTVGLGAMVPGAVVLAIGERSAPLGNPWFTVPDRTKVVGGGVALGVGAAMTIVGPVLLGAFHTHVVMDGQQVAVKVPGTGLSLGPSGLRF